MSRLFELPAYLETSAILRALLERDEGVRTLLRRSMAGGITSRITFVEIARALARGLREGRLSPAQHKEARRQANELADSVDVMPIEEAILDRAQQPFLLEPVRTLDAVHLASMLIYEQQVGRLTVISCDDRVRKNADAYGFDVRPVEAR